MMAAFLAQATQKFNQSLSIIKNFVSSNKKTNSSNEKYITKPSPSNNEYFSDEDSSEDSSEESSNTSSSNDFEHSHCDTPELNYIMTRNAFGIEKQLQNSTRPNRGNALNNDNDNRSSRFVYSEDVSLTLSPEIINPSQSLNTYDINNDNVLLSTMPSLKLTKSFANNNDNNDEFEGEYNRKNRSFMIKQQLHDLIPSIEHVCEAGKQTHYFQLKLTEDNALNEDICCLPSNNEFKSDFIPNIQVKISESVKRKLLIQFADKLMNESILIDYINTVTISQKLTTYSYNGETFAIFDLGLMDNKNYDSFYGIMKLYPYEIWQFNEYKTKGQILAAYDLSLNELPKLDTNLFINNSFEAKIDDDELDLSMLTTDIIRKISIDIVHFASNETIKLTINTNDTIRDVKQKIETKRGYYGMILQLIYQSVLLQDDKMALQYCIKHDSILILFLQSESNIFAKHPCKIYAHRPQMRAHVDYHKNNILNHSNKLDKEQYKVQNPHIQYTCYTNPQQYPPPSNPMQSKLINNSKQMNHINNNEFQTDRKEEKQSDMSAFIEWLRVNDKLKQLYDRFMDNEIDEWEIVKNISDNELKEIGISTTYRKKILLKIREIQNQRPYKINKQPKYDSCSEMDEMKSATIESFVPITDVHMKHDNVVHALHPKNQINHEKQQSHENSLSKLEVSHMVMELSIQGDSAFQKLKSNNQTNLQKIRSLEQELIEKTRQIHELTEKTQHLEALNHDLQLIECKLEDAKQESDDQNFDAIVDEIIENDADINSVSYDCNNENTSFSNEILTQQNMLDIDNLFQEEMVNNPSLFDFSNADDPNNKIVKCTTNPPPTASSTQPSGGSNRNNRNSNIDGSPNRQYNHNGSGGGSGANNAGNNGDGNNNYPNVSGYYANANLWQYIQLLLNQIYQLQLQNGLLLTTVNTQHCIIVGAENTINHLLHLYHDMLQYRRNHSMIQPPRSTTVQSKKKGALRKTQKNQMYIRVNNESQFTPIEVLDHMMYVSNSFVTRFKVSVNLQVNDVRNFMISLFKMHKWPQIIQGNKRLNFGLVDRATNKPVYLSLKLANEKQMKQNYQWELTLQRPFLLIYGFLRCSSSKKDIIIPSDAFVFCHQYYLSYESIHQFRTNSKFHNLSNCKSLEAANIRSICDILKSSITNGKKRKSMRLLEECNWKKISIFNRKNGNKRIHILYTKEQFIRDALKNFSEDDIKIIPIIEYETNETVFVWIVSIGETDIGLSLYYDGNDVRINAIHCDKDYLLQRHYLLCPQIMNNCKCLDGCNFAIDDIHVGNPDIWFNKINILNKRICESDNTFTEWSQSDIKTASMPSTISSIPQSMPTSLLSSADSSNSSSIYYSKR